MNVNPVITFFAGLAAGAGGMFFGMKKYFEKKKDEEVAEERARFHKLLAEARANEQTLQQAYQAPKADESGDDQDLGSERDVERQFVEKPVIDRPIYHSDNPQTEEIMTAYRDILERAHYGEDVNLDEMINEAKKNEPHTIQMMEFGNSSFECISLTYLADHILVDETTASKIPDEEINELIGHEAVQQLVEGEDYVYVRNGALRVDIEIVNDRNRMYAEFVDDQMSTEDDDD